MSKTPVHDRTGLSSSGRGTDRKAPSRADRSAAASRLFQSHASAAAAHEPDELELLAGTETLSTAAESLEWHATVEVPLEINITRPSPEVPDHELLRRFAKGDQEAFVELYLRRQAEVFTFCMRLSPGDPDLASDLFQETFIKVYRKAHTFRVGTNVLGWLYTIVRTTYLNHKRRRTLLPLEEVAGHLASTDRSLHPEHRHEQLTVKERVERAIAHLPLEIREPFILREFDGFSYQEIADQLGISLGGVRQRIYRAKQTMRLELRDLVEDPDKHHHQKRSGAERDPGHDAPRV